MVVTIWLKNEIMSDNLIQGYIFNVIDIFKEELSIKEERELFFKAKKLCLEELFILESKTTGEVKNILRILRDFLEDPKINDETIKLIGNGFSRGYSYNIILEKYFKNLKNNELRSLINNFNNIKDFMFIKMYGHKLKNLSKKDLILVVDEVSSFLLLNIPLNVKGIITKKEPFKPFLKTLISEKDLVVIVSNKKYENDTFVSINRENKEIFFDKKEIKEIPKKSYNKKDFKISLNVSSFDVVDEETKGLIDEIGIFKTEYLFLGKGYISKDAQIDIYKNILKSMYPKKVKMRLFDFKNDKTPCFLKDNLKYGFNLFDYLYHLYEEQLEAMLEANEGLGNLEIIIPEVKEISEFRQVTEVIKIIHKSNQFITILPKIGMMLGTKEAFDNLNAFKEVSFIVVNTNELGKELLDFNENELKNYKNHTNNMIEIIKIVSSFSRKNKISYQITGSLINNEVSFNMLIQRQEKSFSIPKSFLKTALEIINSPKIK